MRISSTLQDPSFRAVVARTTELPDADKFSYWNDVICRTVVDLDCQPIQQRNFEASIEGFETPEIGVYHIHTQPHLVYRSAYEIARLDNDALVINFVTSGTLYSEQDSRGGATAGGRRCHQRCGPPIFFAV
jgi:AraC family transcriptional regulator, positive regulator of tynA and feaB